MSQESSLMKQCLNINIIEINIYSEYVNYLSRDNSLSLLTRVNILNIFTDNFRNYFLTIVLKNGLLQYLKYFQYINTVNYVPKSQKSHA
jgi:hypothetical protein